MATENKDVGSSLGSVFDGASESSSSSESSPAPASTESKEESSPAAGDEKSSSQESSDESKETDTPSDKSKEATEEKTGEKPAADKQKDKPADDASKAASKDAKKDDSPELTYQKRFEDTHKWANELNQQNQQLRQMAERQQQEMTILQKKLDGTWTEKDEEALHKGEATEDVAARAVQVGKGLASRAAALRDLERENPGKGQEMLNSELTRFKQFFANDEIVKAAVANAESPVHEALAVLQRYDFHTKYGNSPKEIHANITKEVRASVEKELRKSILEEIRAGKSTAKETPETLATVRDSGTASGKVDNTESLDKLFG